MRKGDETTRKREARLSTTVIMTLYDQTAGDESRFIPRMAEYYMSHQKLDRREAYREAKWDFRLRNIIEGMSPSELDKLREDLPGVIERAKKRPALKLIKGGRSAFLKSKFTL